MLPGPKKQHKRDKFLHPTSYSELEPSKMPSAEIEEVVTTATTPLHTFNLISNELSSTISPDISSSNILESASSTNIFGSGSGEIPTLSITATKTTNVRCYIFYKFFYHWCYLSHVCKKTSKHVILP